MISASQAFARETWTRHVLNWHFSDIPPVLPIAVKASFKLRNVVAAPQRDCRNALRPSPTRLACSPILSSASLLAPATCSVSGTGRNSPLDVASTLIGSGPLISFAWLLPPCHCVLIRPVSIIARPIGLFDPAGMGPP
jgi:hypothetical protein